MALLGELGRLPPRDGAAWQLWCWHGLPVALYLLLPRGLSALVFYLTGAYTNRPAPGLAASAETYGLAVASDHHATAWTAGLAGLLLIAALLGGRRWQRGGRVVPALIVVGTALVLLHPQVNPRFMISWIAAAWIAGGVGLVVLVDRALVSWTEWSRDRAIAGGAGLLVVLLLAGLAWPPPYQRRTDGGSSLDIAALYLPALAGAKRVGAFANEPIQDFALWTWRARGDEALLFIELAPGSTYSPGLWNHAACAELARLMARDPGFVQAGQWRRPADGVTATLWRRVAAAAD